MVGNNSADHGLPTDVSTPDGTMVDCYGGKTGERGTRDFRGSDACQPGAAFWRSCVQ